MFAMLLFIQLTENAYNYVYKHQRSKVLLLQGKQHVGSIVIHIFQVANVHDQLVIYAHVSMKPTRKCIVKQTLYIAIWKR